MADFIGFVELESTLVAPLLVRDTGLSPVDADSAPVFRVYGPDGILSGVTGACTFLDHGTITTASNATPVVYASANHGLASGFVVTATGVTGNAGANVAGLATVIDTNNFSISGSAGTGSGTGGTWHMTGLYTYTLVASTGNGFESGQTYITVLEGSAGGITFSYSQTFVIT